MKFDLNLIPTVYDSIHVALAATVVGLFFLQMLFLTLAILAFRKKCSPRQADDQSVGRAESAVELAKTPAKAEVPADASKTPESASPDAALQLLSLLQTEARFVDFVRENITSYSDAQIGAAVRVVHEGCARVLKQNFDLEAVRTETEGQRISIPAGFDAATVRLTGNLVGSGPFNGTLVHRGWRVTRVNLPRINEGHDCAILAPAEVEL